MVSIEVYEERFSKLKEVDLGKDKVIEDLISEVKQLEGSLKEKNRDLEREQETAKVYQLKHDDVRIKLQKVEDTIAKRSNGFVSVLIDGDSMPFVDRFVKSAKEGGMDAARHLRSKVYEYVSNEPDLPNNIQIRVRIYANIKGLASTYFYSKILEITADFDAFVRGFNMGHPMGDFVDAGDGKECADSKLRACFDYDIADAQCQAVIFGGSADNGYARLLQPCVGNSAKKKRIILIEGPPFVKELAELKDKFSVACFPDIFRHTKLPVRRVSFSKTPPTTPIPDTLSYAAIANPVYAAAVRPDDAFGPRVTVPARNEYPLLRNSRGERLDAVIIPHQPLVRALRDKKFCNSFHILGECSFPNCIFLHGVRLNEKEIEARRVIARQAPCSSGLRCEDKKCLFGHQCADSTCARIGKGCRFTPEMHSVDRS